MLDAGSIRWSEVLDPATRWDVLVHRAAEPETIAAQCGGIAYLTTPFVEGATKGGRWQLELSAAAEMRAAHDLHLLVRAGCAAVAPAVMWAAMAQAAVALPRRLRVDPLSAEGFARWCQPLRSAAAAIVVPDVPGWRMSAAVWGDVVWALERNMPVHFMGAA